MKVTAKLQIFLVLLLVVPQESILYFMTQEFLEDKQLLCSLVNE